MLAFYIENDLKLRHLRQCPIGRHLDGFADWSRVAGYKQRPAQQTLRGAAHLGHWASAHGVPTERVDDAVSDAFARHLPSCTCPHAFQGRDRYHATGARRFIQYLRTVGIIASVAVEPEPVVPLLKRFSVWMRQHRGVTESTLAHYLPLLQEFLAALGDDAAGYDASRVRDFIFARASRYRHARAKSVVNAVRMFLRFLAVYGYVSPNLVAAVPTIAEWKLASLPRYLVAEDMERLIAVFDPRSASGARDRAVVVLLVRLGLRAGDVRDLHLADIDWSQGLVRVVGKGRCETWLPLPQDAGDAVLHYLEYFRPRIDDEHLFLRLYAPSGPLPSSGPISKLVRRAIQRAGIKAPSMGAHVLRHSAATALLREGASLDTIGTILRHRCVESTAHVAKVDDALLRGITQAWPTDGEPSC